MATADAESAPAGPPSGKSSYALLWGLLLVVAVLDWVTKWWIVAHSGFGHGVYPPRGGLEIIPGFFSLVYATNYGAAWGMFQGKGWLLVILAVVAVVAIYLFRRSLELSHRIPQVAFGLILGGIIGNTYDRLVHGHVIDFLDVHLGFYRWPTFNIADCGIVIGTGLYLIYAWRSDAKGRAKS